MNCFSSSTVFARTPLLWGYLCPLGTASKAIHLIRWDSVPKKLGSQEESFFARLATCILSDCSSWYSRYTQLSSSRRLQMSIILQPVSHLLTNVSDLSFTILFKFIKDKNYRFSSPPGLEPDCRPNLKG